MFKPMPRLAGTRSSKAEGSVLSPLSSGVVARLFRAGTLAALLWIAAAWAMGWLA